MLLNKYHLPRLQRPIHEAHSVCVCVCVCVTQRKGCMLPKSSSTFYSHDAMIIDHASVINHEDKKDAGRRELLGWTASRGCMAATQIETPAKDSLQQRLPTCSLATLHIPMSIW